MESQPQNPELRSNLENSLPCNDYFTFGALAAAFAASLYWPFWNSMLNFFTNNSSAPGRLDLDAIFRARSGFCRVLLTYGTILSSSTLTDKT